MRVIVLYLILLLKLQASWSDDGFVTLWAPKTLFEGGDYSIYLQPKGLNSRIKSKVSFQFRKKNATVNLEDGKGFQLKFPSSTTTGTRKNFELIMTLYRKITSSSPPVELCITKSFNITSEKRQYYTFVQMDKPIYKPGDEVKFRVLVIDRNLKPYHMNNIHINITDPLDRSIQELKDLGDSYLGVFSSAFTLSQKTSLGDWKIRVVVDKLHNYEYSKVFPVQEYETPHFDIILSVERKHMLTTDDLKLSFHAQFIFGESVIGNAELAIVDPKDGKKYLSESFQNIQGVQKLTYSIKHKLKVTTTSKLTLEAQITFSEPESSHSVNRSIQFVVHGDANHKIQPLHDNTFVPGLPFNIKVFIYEWNGEILQHSREQVYIKYNYKLSNNQKKDSSGNVEIVDGYATFYSIVPRNAVGLSIEVKFLSNVYRKTIPKGKAGIGRNEMIVFYLPKIPKLNDEIEVSVESTSALGTVVVILMSRNGMSKTLQFDCQSKLNCKFPVKVTEDLIPQSTISVYFVQDTRTIIFGQTTLVTEEIGQNFLDVSLPITSKTKEKIKMTFKSDKNSKIYLLAFDKALSSLRTGNDVKKSDIVSSIADFNSGSNVYIARLKSWKTCTVDDIRRVESGTIDASSHTGDTLYAPGSSEDDEIALDDMDEHSDEATDPVEDGLLRDNFPETWIFQEFAFDEDESLVKEFTVPDSITSWMVSAFSVNEDSGFALAPTKELSVKNEFFMKMILPYSIKFGEVFRLDILVYNYLRIKSSTDVKVELHNLDSKEFEFVEYNGTTPTFNSAKKLAKSVTVPHSNLKKVSFHIRPRSSDNQGQGYPRPIKFYVFGDTKDNKGNVYKDKAAKKLRVEPAGIKIYDIENFSNELDGSRDFHHEISIGNVHDLQKSGMDFPKISVAVAGDYLTDTINMDSRYEFYPTDGLEQKTSKLKGNVEYFRYMLSTSNRPATSRFSDYYQSLFKQQTARWGFGAPAGYRAYFGEAIASAMEIGAIPANKRIIQKELDALKDLQTEDGDFNNFGSFPEFLTTNREDTATFFRTSFVLIPFLRFKSFVNKSYEDVIIKGIKYLDKQENRLKTDNEGLSIAAYVYALNGNHDEAQNLLNKIEEEKFQISEKQRCLKISRSHANCDIRHTSYAAIAYFTMNKGSLARPLINWLLESHNLNKYYSNTHSYAIATEAIAKLASSRRSHGTTFTVSFKNEGNFNQTVNIEQKNVAKPFVIDFPDFSLKADIRVSGYGYFSITTIIEKTVTLGKTTPNFRVTVTQTNKKSNSNEKTLKVCGVYDPKDDAFNMATLLDVIYDVELPSGYIYLSVVDYEIRAHDIKMVAQKQKGSRVIIYFNDFKQSEEYCVEIRVKKAFEVNGAKDAGVKVYSFNDKQKMTIVFYNLN